MIRKMKTKSQFFLLTMAGHPGKKKEKRKYCLVDKGTKEPCLAFMRDGQRCGQKLTKSTKGNKKRNKEARHLA